MREYVNEFQTVTKQVPGSAQENIEINIKEYNSVKIFNNTIFNIISWDSIENYILPQQFVDVIKGDTDQYLYGKLIIILVEQIVGFPEPKCVLIKKRYNNATV
jgi:hypothetical protein